MSSLSIYNAMEISEGYTNEGSSVLYETPNKPNPQICELNKMRCNMQYATYGTLMWISSSRDASSSHKARSGKGRNIPLNTGQQKHQYSKWLRKDVNE
jgi:hypothetical protein